MNCFIYNGDNIESGKNRNLRLLFKIYSLITCIESNKENLSKEVVSRLTASQTCLDLLDTI
jgi:hypothetical protein